MLSLTIDGHHITVPPGTTILEAAHWLGIRIPTMCHVPGIEAAGSCFICAVQIEGRRTLTPACAMPAADGMVVVTDSDDVRNARKMALELLLSDHAGECVAPCAARCPAGLDIPGFVRGVAAGNQQQAAEIIGQRLALPGSLGRICPRLCEEHCRRSDLDEALSIGALHRYVADLAPYVPARAAASGKSVAIIGGGPAGLTAAFYLAQKGHACTILDAHDQPGGMLRYGIPAYRLPKDALDLEIGIVRELGVQFQMGRRWGEHFSLAGLREKHDAVFIAIGAQRSRALGCEGQEHALDAAAFLANATYLGERVVVVGGGNTAIDCARTAVRQGAREVRIVYRRGRHEMPCLMEEVEEAEAEGVHLDLLTVPVMLEHSPGGIRLTCRRMQLGEPDDSGRARPVPVAGSEFTVDCSTVISAIGLSVERELAAGEGLAVTDWGIAADAHTLATNLPGVFAGGDAVLGPDLAVRAVAAGRMAAASIDQYLSGEPVTGEATMASVAMRPIDDAERAAMFRAIEKSARVPVLTDADAMREAQRCLTCGCRKADCCQVRSLATEYGADTDRFTGARRRFRQDLSHPEIMYEPGKCISCGACVRIAAAEGEELGLALTGRGFDVTVAVPFDMPLAAGLRHSARRCAEACPTAALAFRTAQCIMFH